MSQVPQATPTLQANVGGLSTTVNLRDWLNTRVGPFLKRAIIESLDSEAQYPLQWLGEQLILQSIEHEGNLDSTNIRERFLYKHELKANVTQGEPIEVDVAPPAEVVAVSQNQAITSQTAAASDVEATAPDHQEPETDSSQTVRVVTDEAEESQPVASASDVNGTKLEAPEADQVQDTEMTNAP